MKLYTEYEIYKAFRLLVSKQFLEGTIDGMKSIELPSDEEIYEYVKSTGYYGHCAPEYHEGIQEGAEWMRDKIQGGNK